MTDSNIISVKNLTKTYLLYNSHSDRVKEVFHPLRKKYHHPFNALTDISLDIQKGETVGIVGRNGSGKSTLLQIICGILQPTAGMAQVSGRVSALLELGAGFNPEFTGRQNIFINAAIIGLNREEINDRLEAILDFADIGEFVDQPVKTYSSGMYVRLAFAIAINVEPDILVVDEALSVGDTSFQAKCFAKFQEFQDKGVTILFVTHALDLITRYCSTALLLENGMIHAAGSPKEIVDEYNRLIVNCTRKEIIHTDGANICIEQTFLKQNQWNGLFQVNPNENLYGNGKANILEAGIFNIDGDPVQSLRQGEYYEFLMKVRFRAELQDPIFAYTIKDVKGFDISGTNTLFQNIPTGSFDEGDVVLCRFKHRIFLNAGGYLLSFGCAGYEDGDYVVYERRYDHFTFDVISDRQGVGIFDLNSEISIHAI